MNIIAQTVTVLYGGASGYTTVLVPTNGQLKWVDFNGFMYADSAFTGAGVAGMYVLTSDIATAASQIVASTGGIAKVAAGGELICNLEKFARVELPVRYGDRLYVYGFAGTSMQLNGAVTLAFIPRE